MSATYPNGATFADNTPIEFNCSVDAFPSPILALWCYDGTDEHKASYKTVTGNHLSIPFIFHENHDGVEFYCVASLHDPEYQLSSGTIIYHLAGKCCKY